MGVFEGVLDGVGELDGVIDSVERWELDSDGVGVFEGLLEGDTVCVKATGTQVTARRSTSRCKTATLRAKGIESLRSIGLGHERSISLRAVRDASVFLHLHTARRFVACVR